MLINHAHAPKKPININFTDATLDFNCIHEGPELRGTESTHPDIKGRSGVLPGRPFLFSSLF